MFPVSEPNIANVKTIGTGVGEIDKNLFGTEEIPTIFTLSGVIRR